MSNEIPNAPTLHYSYNENMKIQEMNNTSVVELHLVGLLNPEDKKYYLNLNNHEFKNIPLIYNKFTKAKTNITTPFELDFGIKFIWNDENLKLKLENELIDDNFIELTYLNENKTKSLSTYNIENNQIVSPTLVFNTKQNYKQIILERKFRASLYVDIFQLLMLSCLLAFNINIYLLLLFSIALGYRIFITCGNLYHGYKYNLCCPDDNDIYQYHDGNISGYKIYNQSNLPFNISGSKSFKIKVINYNE